MPSLNPFGKALQSLAKKAGSGALRAAEAAVSKGKPVVEKVGEVITPVKEKLEAEVLFPLQIKLGEAVNPVRSTVRPELEDQLAALRKARLRVEKHAAPEHVSMWAERQEVRLLTTKMREMLKETASAGRQDGLRTDYLRTKGLSIKNQEDAIAFEENIPLYEPSNDAFPVAEILQSREKVRALLLERFPQNQAVIDEVTSLMRDVREFKNPADLFKLLDRFVNPNNPAEIDANMDLMAGIAVAIKAVAPDSLVKLAGPAPQGVFHLLTGRGAPTDFGITVERMLKNPRVLHHFGVRELRDAGRHGVSLDFINAAKNFVSHFPDGDIKIGDLIPVRGQGIFANSVGQAFLVRNKRGGFDLVDDYRFYDTQSRGAKSMPPTLEEQMGHTVKATTAWGDSKDIVRKYVEYTASQATRPTIKTLRVFAEKALPERGADTPVILDFLRRLETKASSATRGNPNEQNVGWYIDRMLHRKGTPYPVVIKDIDRIMAANLYHETYGLVPPVGVARGDYSHGFLRVKPLPAGEASAASNFSEQLAIVRAHLTKRTMTDTVQEQGQQKTFTRLRHEFKEWLGKEYPAFSAETSGWRNRLDESVFLNPLEAVIFDDFLKHQKNGTLKYFIQNEALRDAIENSLFSKGYPTPHTMGRADWMDSFEPWDAIDMFSRAFDYAKKMDINTPRAEAINALLKKHGYEPTFSPLPRTSKLYESRSAKYPRFHGDVEASDDLTPLESQILSDMAKTGVIPPETPPRTIGLGDIAKYFDSLPEEEQLKYLNRSDLVRPEGVNFTEKVTSSLARGHFGGLSVSDLISPRYTATDAELARAWVHAAGVEKSLPPDVVHPAALQMAKLFGMNAAIKRRFTGSKLKEASFDIKSYTQNVTDFIKTKGNLHNNPTYQLLRDAGALFHTLIPPKSKNADRLTPLFNEQLKAIRDASFAKIHLPDETPELRANEAIMRAWSEGFTSVNSLYSTP